MGTQQLLLEIKSSMDKTWDRRRSIVNRHHMKDVQQKMDSEYKAHLRHQEQVRELTERMREKQALSQRAPNLFNLYSTRSYSKPWQKGMNTKPVKPTMSRPEERQNREHQYKSTVSKLPAIKKDKDILSNKTAYNPHQTHKLITVSQPRITVEKKRLHVHQLSAKSRITCAAGDTSRSKNALKLQTKAKEPKRPVKHQKQTLKEKAFTNATEQPYIEQYMVPTYDVDHHDSALPTILNMNESAEEPQITRRSSSSSWSHLQEPDNVFIEQSQRNMDQFGEAFDEDNLSYVSDIISSVRAHSSNTSLTGLIAGGSDCADSPEEDNINSDIDEYASAYREDEEPNTGISHSTIHGLDISPGNNSYFGQSNLEPLHTSWSLQEISPPTGTEVADQSPNSPQNLRDTVEIPRINASITLPQIYAIIPNTNVQNHENHALPQTALRDLDEREMDRLSREYPAVPSSPAPQRLSISSTAPNIALLRENLDLVFNTLSMQRQSRRSLENIVPTSKNEEAEKPRSDPEKLKMIQASLLQEDSEEEGDLCRICLMGGETTENHLIAPCQCSGSLKYVHTECMKKWLLAKIKSGTELNIVSTCEMCKHKLKCEIEGFDLREHYRKHQETQASLNPSLYLVLLLHLYQQRYEELLQLSHSRDRISELSRRFLHLGLGRREHARDDEQNS
ncbi:putative E3 ubiquitin-protein ligase MARCHF10 isoform X2 [Ranitomeya variabilis]|uniref:putative E3 ubiquitin-protein ligase MARCHF10 isoform X2 n=1 Tax=Ranitomeya variabilis TaxID=490064 RepID=UPI0040569C5E